MCRPQDDLLLLGTSPGEEKRCQAEKESTLDFFI